MKINNLKVNAYGNIEDKDINLSSGINIIHGRNESGKSTLLNYIVSSFYGISKNKDGKFLSDYEKYKPWNNTEFSGRIQYELDNGEKFEIFRDFNKKNPKIYNDKLEDITNQYEIDKRDGSKFFFEQIGIDKQMYLSTVVSMQEEVRLEDKDQNILVQKIANLAGTGEDNVSYKKALTKLQDKIRDEIGTNKTTQKPINLLEKEINNIEKRIEEINPYRDRKYEIDSEKEKIEELIKQLEIKEKMLIELQDSMKNEDVKNKEIELKEANKNENLSKIAELKNKESELNKDVDKINENIESTRKYIENKKKEQEKIDTEMIDIKTMKIEEDSPKSNNVSIVFLIIFIVLILLGAVSILKLKNYAITAALGFLVILDIIFYVNKMKKQSKHKKEKSNKIKAENSAKINELEKKQKDLLVDITEKIEQLKKHEDNEREISNEVSMIKGQIILLEKNNERISDEVKIIKENLKNKGNYKKEEIINKYKEQVDDITELLKNEDYKVKDIEELINNYKVKIKGLEIEYNTIVPQLDEIVMLEEKLESDLENLDELKYQEETINIAIKNLTEAYEEMKTTITPKFTKSLSSSIDKISNNKYNKVTINDENGMIIENDRGEYIEAAKLSAGTIDQLYLALRLSMIDDLSKEELPIILDETFAYFDNDRLKNALQYLNEELQNHQTIIFTCNNREKEILENMKIKFNLIEL